MGPAFPFAQASLSTLAACGPNAQLALSTNNGLVLRDRRHLSEDGLVLAVLAIHQQSGEIVGGPDLVSHGVVGEDAITLVMMKLRKLAERSDGAFAVETIRGVGYTLWSTP